MWTLTIFTLSIFIACTNARDNFYSPFSFPCLPLGCCWWWWLLITCRPFFPCQSLFIFIASYFIAKVYARKSILLQRISLLHFYFFQAKEKQRTKSFSACVRFFCFLVVWTTNECMIVSAQLHATALFVIHQWMDGIKLKGRRCKKEENLFLLFYMHFAWEGIDVFSEMVLISWALLDQMAIILMQYKEHEHTQEKYISYVVYRLYVFISIEFVLQLQFMDWPWSEQCGCVYARECFLQRLPVQRTRLFTYNEQGTIFLHILLFTFLLLLLQHSISSIFYPLVFPFDVGVSSCF